MAWRCVLFAPIVLTLLTLLPARGASAAEGPADAGVASSTARTFTLDPKQSSLVVQVWKAGAASAFAHDHTVEAKDVTGEVTWDPAHPEQTRLSVTVQTATLDNDDPDTRARFGLPRDGLSPKDREAVRQNMLGSEQLHVKRYPTISFRSTSMKVGKDGALSLVGDFSFHGTVKTITVPCTVEAQANKVIGKAQVKLKTSEYGMAPFSAFLGTIKNKDEVLLHLHLVGVDPR